MADWTPTGVKEHALRLLGAPAVDGPINAEVDGFLQAVTDVVDRNDELRRQRRALRRDLNEHKKRISALKRKVRGLQDRVIEERRWYDLAVDCWMGRTC